MRNGERLSEGAWLEVFRKYQGSVQYREVNHWMALADFKRIFFWEYTHRLLGRLTGAAVLLRIVFAAIIVVLLGLPYLKLVGGLLLLWIAIQFATEDNDAHDVKAAPSLWGAIRVIAIADGVMSLDNVIAIAAAAIMKR